MVTDPHPFVFRRQDSVGTAAAEDDEAFLHSCFVDTGDISYLKDSQNPLRVIVGRTGAGKTALIAELSATVENKIAISPHELSLNYIANNGVIEFFEAAGVNLSPFYGLLWKHILVVELLKEKFEIRDEESQRRYANKVRQLLYKKDKTKEMAVDYLEKWGDKFWLTTEERIRELTTNISTNLKGSLNAGFAGATLNAEAARELTSEERKEIVHRGQEAVSKVQIRELDMVISILAESVFNDKQQTYFVLIDMLDEEWADDRIRFKLIRSLLDTIRRFKKIQNVKIIASMRQDLLDKVIRSTSETGFQEEKFESLYLRIKWSRAELREVIEKRISHLVQHKYTSQLPRVSDVFSGQVGGMEPIEYMIDRTFLRPRDIIQFINLCIQEADGLPAITGQHIRNAEHEYSEKRLKSLCTEWKVIHPNLHEVSRMLFGFRDHFDVSELSEELILEKYERIARDIEDPDSDALTRRLNIFYIEGGNFRSIRASLLADLFVIGLIGVKVSSGSPVRWSLDSRGAISASSIRASSIVYIHPMFHRALEIRTRRDGET